MGCAPAALTAETLQTTIAECKAKMKELYVSAGKEMFDGKTPESDYADELAELKELFEGKDGVLSEARKLEAEGNAGMEKTIIDLEALQSQITGLKEQTIAECLEADPEMRKEIEEEMKNHQWGV